MVNRSPAKVNWWPRRSSAAWALRSDDSATHVPCTASLTLASAASLPGPADDATIIAASRMRHRMGGLLRLVRCALHGSELDGEVHSRHHGIADARDTTGIDHILDVRLNGEPAPDGNCIRPFEHHLVGLPGKDRKSTRLNSSHVRISYAV